MSDRSRLELLFLTRLEWFAYYLIERRRSCPIFHVGSYNIQCLFKYWIPSRGLNSNLMTPIYEKAVNLMLVILDLSVSHKYVLKLLLNLYSNVFSPN